MTARTFTWRKALLGRYDVFHVHWPENLMKGRSRLKTLLRQILTVVLVAKLTLTRTPIVRTLHNLKRPAEISTSTNVLLALLERRTALYILLNNSETVPQGKPWVAIVHGHYRDWFVGVEQPDPIAGRLSYFGLIRRYKGVDVLIKAFADFTGAYTLRVAGEPSSAELAESLTALAAADPRVHLTLDFLSDAELARVACESEMVVLPYREMHNSGGTLTALSLGRPVLVPDNDVNRELSREVGEGWVLTYPGDLTESDLHQAVDSVRTLSRSPQPDLSRRDWLLTGQQHRAAYRQVLLPKPSVFVS